MNNFWGRNKKWKEKNSSSLAIKICSYIVGWMRDEFQFELFYEKLIKMNHLFTHGCISTYPPLFNISFSLEWGIVIMWLDFYTFLVRWPYLLDTKAVNEIIFWGCRSSVVVTSYRMDHKSPNSKKLNTSFKLRRIKVQILNIF